MSNTRLNQFNHRHSNNIPIFLKEFCVEAIGPRCFISSHIKHCLSHFFSGRFSIQPGFIAMSERREVSVFRAAQCTSPFSIQIIIKLSCHTPQDYLILTPFSSIIFELQHPICPSSYFGREMKISCMLFPSPQPMNS